MRKYKINRKIDSIVCNKCGKTLKITKGMVQEGVFCAEYQWGYFSKKDGEIHTFDLCEQCYDEMISGFEIQPKIKKATEMI